MLKQVITISASLCNHDLLNILALIYALCNLECKAQITRSKKNSSCM